MAKTSTTGMQIAAKAGAPAAPAAVVPGSHTFVAMQSFSFPFNGCLISYRAGQRYVVEAALKAAISASDADVTWDN